MTSTSLPSRLTPQVFTLLCLAVIAVGIVLRFINITHHDFIFYDEGMYLAHNRDLLEKIHQYPPKNFTEFWAIIKILFATALMTAKWLWFFISNLRVFFEGPDMLHFTRIVSAVCGTATLGLTYLFSRRYFKSHEIGLLSAAVLAVLPGHVFYSRLAMQEALSTLCFLGGMYLYFSSREFSVRTILAAVVFSAVYFTNYRMIVLPLLLIAAEFIESLGLKKTFNWIKAGGCVMAFLGIVFWIGSLNHGSNRAITSAWMTHQAQDASAKLHWFNVLSYPFEIFVLEGILFGVLLFSNAVRIARREWSLLLPFALVLVQMTIFTAASEKGARYLCVVLPFAAMAAASAFYQFVLQHQSVKRLRWASIILLALLLLASAQRSFAIALSNTGYERVAQLVRDSSAKLLATQPIVLSVMAAPGQVKPAPKNVRDLIILYAQGYRYLIIDPQAYVSWTQSGERFTPQLGDYMGFIRNQMKPSAVIDHLNRVMLERFVLDHNENLANTIRFLAKRDQNFGAIYVYDLKECLEVMQRIAGQGGPS